MSDYGPSIDVTKLREYTSAKGTRYLSGFMGGIKVAIFLQTEQGPNGEPIWKMTFSEAPKRDKPPSDR